MAKEYDVFIGTCHTEASFAFKILKSGKVCKKEKILIRFYHLRPQGLDSHI